MGVRGLTTYIADNADQYLDPFELHDCNLVIDGDSLASSLYKSDHNSAFGGNYDQYYRVICNFFGMLKQCNVTPYVLLDGGYQPKKLNTVRRRLRSKIGALKHINPFRSQPMFPIMMREVFIEAMDSCKVHYMRCVFEADDEVATLSRKLKCPVLSFDSDFYIHNVMYIPSVTLNFKVFRRNLPDKDNAKKVRQRKELVSEMDSDGECQNFKGQKVEKDSVKQKKDFYYYMQCSIYRIKNLARGRRLRTEMLPLFAILLGNDYIQSSVFKKFYLNVSLKRTGKNNTQQYRRIVALLRWLQNETLASAIEKIIGHIEKEKKDWIRAQINIGMAGYKLEHSEAYEYFGFTDGEVPSNDLVVNDETVEDLTDEETTDGEEEAETSESEESDDATESNEENDVAPVNMNDFEMAQFTPPDWLLEKILSGRLPRYIVDLLTLRLYINAPQVENFLLKDCNLISVPILRLVFTILHAPEKREFRYLTRVQRRTDIEYKHFESLDIDTKFDPNQKDNFETFKLILDDFEKSEEIFAVIEHKVPANLRLFFIAIIYWSQYSDHFNVVYVSSLILCQIVLGVNDPILQPFRDRMKFDKFHKPNTIKKTTQKGDPPTTIQECLDRITKDQCILAQSNLLDLFFLSSKIRTKHTEFSSDILHGFAEFQAIAYQINSLNILCGERYPNIEMSKCFTGLFLYNAYTLLKERPNVKYYIQKFLLPDSPALFSLYESMIEVLTPFIECLSKETISKRKKRRNINKKLARERRKTAAMEQAAADAENVSEHSGSEFEDLNNKFSLLLKN